MGKLVDEETIQTYLDDNYQKELLRSLSVNFALFYDIDGNLLYNRTAYSDPTNENDVPIPQELRRLPSNINDLMTNIDSRLGGIIMENSTNQIVIFTVTPVLTGDLSL